MEDGAGYQSWKHDQGVLPLAERSFEASNARSGNNYYFVAVYYCHGCLYLSEGLLCPSWAGLNLKQVELHNQQRTPAETSGREPRSSQEADLEYADLKGPLYYAILLLDQSTPVVQLHGNTHESSTITLVGEVRTQFCSAWQLQ